jgi:hypothetical protein
MPPLQALAIDPGLLRVVLGQLNVQERRKLVAELRRFRAPSGSPSAGEGGASSGGGVSRGWLAVGVTFLAISGVAGIGLSRRRGSS